MGKIERVLIINFLFTLYAFAQLKDTIVFDAATRNYRLYYTVTLEYAQSENGSLRRIEYKDEVYPNEKIIEKDTVVSVLFEPATIVNALNKLI